MSRHAAVRTRPTAHRALVSAVVLLIGALLLAVVQVPGAEGAFIAKIGNSSNTAATARYFSCSSYATDTVAGKPTFDYSFADSAPLVNPSPLTTIADASGNNAVGTAVNVKLGVSNSSPAVCPRDRGTVATFDGKSSYAVGPKTAIAGPNTFTVEAWFKTSTAGGKIIGFGSSASGSSASYDRQLYIGTDGDLYFTVFPNSYVTLSTTTQVNDGKWHLAVGTESSSGLSLYLDGNLVASNSNTTAQVFSGYWRIGYDNIATWPNVGQNFYFNGQLAWVAVWNSTALNASTIAAQYAAGAPQ